MQRWTHAWREQRALGSLIDAELRFETLLDLLPSSGCETTAIASTDPEIEAVTFGELAEFLAEVPRLDDYGLRPGDRCAIALPEGAALAVCLLAVATRCAATPMNPWNPAGELAGDLLAADVRAVIVQAGEEFEPVRRTARELGMAVIDLVPRRDQAGLFDLHGQRSPRAGPVRWNGPDDIALTIFTSGTTGRKKLVPIRLQDLCVGAAALASALELGPRDRGLNMMPMFHVGGIVRNLFAPFLAGSSMIYSTGYDPELFWELLERGAAFNWYYASPTMHEGILQAGAQRPAARHPLRFICNAAGELLPSTAARLRQRFGDAAVLPGYGMTECMPIACPPLDYRLERPGASGRILGPQVSIRDACGSELPAGVAGRILLRGVPVARLEPARVDASEVVTPAGWFDTGDIGRFDDDGYLYVVGRGKDIIKRGGETIAPAEVEEALASHPDIGAVLAFAVPHATLGETVGALVVPRSGRRAGLAALASHLSGRLAPAKWPVLLVYVDSLPKNATGKLVRSGLAARLGIPGVDEQTPEIERLLEAQCTPPQTPMPCQRLSCDAAQVLAAVRACCPPGTAVLACPDQPNGATRVVVLCAGLAHEELAARLKAQVHDYLMPQAWALVDELPRSTASGVADRAALESVFAGSGSAPAAPADEIEAAVLAEWQAGLAKHREVGLDSDFFDDLGGGSLAAVRIIASLRVRFGVALPPTAIFRHRTVRRLAAAVRCAAPAAAAPATAGASAAPTAQTAGSGMERDASAPPPDARSSAQTAWFTQACQLLPIALLPPLLRVGQLLCVVLAVWLLRSELGQHGLWVAPAALAIAYGLRQIVLPLGAIATKWLVVGRFRPGRAALWGPAYLRWWLVRQCLRTAGPGVFALSFDLTALYLRLLGARVGRRTRILPTADLGEFDLISIGDGVCIEEAAVVRPFQLECGAMVLRPISIGADCTLGIRSIVVPGADLPAGTDIAPLASSAESHGRDLGTRALCRPLIWDPPTALQWLGAAIIAGVSLLAWAPVFLAMQAVVAVLMPPHAGALSMHELLVRMMRPERLAGFWAMAVTSAVVSPFLYLGGVIAVKRLVIGRFRSDDDLSRPWQVFRRWLMWQLLPDGHFGNAAPLLGSNFAAISVIYRMLGADIGKRVYWPGSGHVLVEYDLFSCGDDVTFGSRSTFLMSSAHGSKPIRIQAGANVADRCVVAPGVTIRRNAVLGSGTFAPEDFDAPAGSTWIGLGASQPIELEAGSSRRANAATLRPYGLAMYLGQASYPVWPLAAHIAFNLVVAVLVASWQALPLMAAATMVHSALSWPAPGLDATPNLVLLLFAIYVPCHLVSATATLGILVWSKWRMIGLRTPGDHHWHLSSYCQRWKLHNVVASVIRRWCGGRDLLAFLEGSAHLVRVFRALGASIGTNVCLYPNGADPLMEEPEFVTIGDGAAIDQAVLIAHLNTRGEWTMGPIHIGARACLRSMSRVMMIGTVGEGALLEEHALLLAGDACPPATRWRGWPGEAVAGATAATGLVGNAIGAASVRPAVLRGGVAEGVPVEATIVPMSGCNG